MQGPFKPWVQNNIKTAGVLAFGIYAPGRDTFVERCEKSLPAEAIERAWRCVAETLPVLQLNQFPTARFRFVFGQAVVHCERRHDGACLGIFARKDTTAFPQASLERLLTEFHSL